MASYGRHLYLSHRPLDDTGSAGGLQYAPPTLLPDTDKTSTEHQTSNGALLQLSDLVSAMTTSSSHQELAIASRAWRQVR